LGLYLSRIIPLLGGIGLALDAGLRRRVYLGAALLLCAVSLLSGSRGNWIALGVAAVLVALLTRRFRWLVPAAAAGVLSLLAMIATGQNRLATLFRTGRGSGDTRERLWRAAIAEIRREPLFGRGLGDVGWMRRYIPAKRLASTELVDAHNLFLDFWTKLGLLGLASILWLVAAFYWVAWGVYRRGERTDRVVAIGLMAAMTGAVVHGMLDAFYFGLQLAVLFWFSLGVVEVLARREARLPRRCAGRGPYGP
ncbi:MAG: O-antigen ligase family protein, partial [Chloroflexota bacterium]|nr:O-antigen ligase family protein [Chloroflexota bacterium]